VFLSSHLLGELALIAQQVIVIGRGRVIADMPVEELTRAQDRVRVRTPDWDDLCKVVVASGATFEVLEPQVIEIVGLKAEQVARLASSVHASLFEMTPIVRTLEQAYTELTRGVVEFEATDSNRR
jgi:ABC-2 type transport system ATP-binding protein